MTPQIMRILNKLYKYDNQTFNGNVSIYSEDKLSEKERVLLSEYGWKTNEVVHFADHDDVIKKLYSIKNHPAITQKRVLDSFVAGVGGSYLRGLSVLPAWHYLEKISLHSYDEKPQYACCLICSATNKTQYINNSDFQYCLYRGNAYSSSPLYAYLNIKHLVEAPAITPTKEDIKCLSDLFYLLRTAPDDETPGKFEKRLNESKILKGDKYTRRGLLNSLALVGVIPNQFIDLSYEKWTDWGAIVVCEKELKNTQGRSDMEMPWAGWYGALKLSEEKVSKLFGDYFKAI